MKCTKCDKCGKIAEINSRVMFRYRCRVIVAEDYEPQEFIDDIRKESYDLCESCAEELYKAVFNRSSFPRRVI